MKKKSENSSTRLVYFIGIGLLVLIATGYFLSKANDKELDAFGVQTEGVVVQISHRMNRGEFVRYEYVVNGEKYTYEQQMNREVRVGERFEVIYSGKNPKLSKMLFNRPVK